MRLFQIFKRKTSSEIAKDRLKILLISDRVNCSPEMMELIKNDIAQVISKYMQIDTSSMEVQIAKTVPLQEMARRHRFCTRIFLYWIFAADKMSRRKGQERENA